MITEEKAQGKASGAARDMETWRAIKAKGIDPCDLVRNLRERENDGRTGPGLRPLDNEKERD
jgi:hypothetical protein